MSHASRYNVNWPAIELRYRGGTESLAVIASDHGITDSAIVQHARKHGWKRDLASRAEDRANALLNELLSATTPAALEARAAAESQYVEVAAQLRVRASVLQAGRLAKAMKLYDDLLQQLSRASNALPRSVDWLPLSNRIVLLENMARVLERLTLLERRVLRMDSPQAQTSGAPSPASRAPVTTFPNGGPGCGHARYVDDPLDTQNESADDDDTRNPAH